MKSISALSFIGTFSFIFLTVPTFAGEGAKGEIKKSQPTQSKPEVKTQASSDTEAELKKRIEELKAAVAGVSDSLTKRSNERSEEIKAELKAELAEISQRLDESKDRLAQATQETQDQVRQDLGKVLKDLGTSINQVGSKVEEKSETKKK